MASGDVRYREAGIDDVAAIARVNSDTLRECGLAAAEMSDPERLRKRWELYLLRRQHPQHALEPRIAFAATFDVEIIGYIAGHFSRRFDTEGELQSIYVLPRWHRQGIGTELLIRLAGWFTAHDRRRVCVGIEPANPWRRFYEKHGARYLNEQWLIWDDVSRMGRDAGGSIP